MGGGIMGAIGMVAARAGRARRARRAGRVRARARVFMALEPCLDISWCLVKGVAAATTPRDSGRCLETRYLLSSSVALDETQPSSERSLSRAAPVSWLVIRARSTNLGLKTL